MFEVFILKTKINVRIKKMFYVNIISIYIHVKYTDYQPDLLLIFSIYFFQYLNQ